MKPRLLGLALVVSFPLAAVAQESGPSGPSPGVRAPGHGSGVRKGGRPGHLHGGESRRHGHPVGCRCCSGAPILFPPIVVSPGGFFGEFGYGYGGFSGFSGISIGPIWPTPWPAYPSRPSYGRTPVLQNQGRTTRRAKPKLSSPEARARAAQFIEFGDRAFQQQDYGHALSRYKKAVGAAPDQGAARFRVAQAYVAIGRFALAVREVERGLYVDPTWPDSDFSIEGLYGGNEVARLSHLERLAQAVRDEMDNGELLFLLGYQLFFSGEPERAIPFFERALDLTDAPDLVLPFLRSPLPQAADAPFASEPAPENATPPEANPSDSRRI